MRIQINLFILKQIRIHLFHFNPDPEADPAPHQIEENLRPLFYRPSRAPFWASSLLLWTSTALHVYLCFGPLKILIFEVNADRDPAFHSNADPDPAFHSNADPDLASQNNAGSWSATPTRSRNQIRVVMRERIHSFLSQIRILTILSETCKIDFKSVWIFIHSKKERNCDFFKLQYLTLNNTKCICLGGFFASILWTYFEFTHEVTLRKQTKVGDTESKIPAPSVLKLNKWDILYKYYLVAKFFFHLFSISWLPMSSVPSVTRIFIPLCYH